MRIVIIILILLAAFSPALSAGSPQSGVMMVTSFDGTLIDIIACPPPGASPAAPAPVILHSHGWGGARASDCGGFGSWHARGFGVVSISQRGFGDSGGEAHVQDPDYEARDNMAVIDRVAGFDWVLLDAPGDPVMGAIGASYGGGFQLITALAETELTGSTRFNALAPEIAWHDLPEALAPSGVIRTTWVSALYVAGAKDVHVGIHEAFAYGLATGQLPDGSAPLVHDLVSDLHGNSPAAFVERGVRLDIPVLFHQGLTDNLFNLNQGVQNFERVLTPEARAQSYLLASNGGHSIPSFLPEGFGLNHANGCTGEHGGFGTLARRFFENELLGTSHPMPSTPYALTSAEGTCLRLDSVVPTHSFIAGDVVSTTGAGAPQHIALARGPLTIAGIPYVEATLTSLGVEQRAFLALSKGTSPLDARIIQNNMMPVRAALPTSSQSVTIELAGIASVLQEGETLYLTVSPVSDMSAGHGSRAPGLILLEDARVHVQVSG